MRKAKRSMGKSRKPAGWFSEAGFTLIEVMSAMVILAIAMTGAYATFTFQHMSFTVQNRVAEAQQNLRTVLEIMGRDIRLAGYGIPASVNLPPTLVIPGGDNTIRNIRSVNSAVGPDEIYILYMYDMDSTAPLPTATAAMGGVAPTLTVDTIAGFSNGDLVLIRNDVNADMFEVTQTPAGGTLNFDVGGSANLYNSLTAHPLFPGYAAGDIVAKARFIRYFVGTDPGTGRPALMVDRNTGPGQGQPLADDIEDMQIQYGLDTDNDYVVETWVDAPALTQVPQIKQIGLFLSARTRMIERGWQDAGRPALADRAAGAPDAFRRRIIDNVVIDLRNPG